MEDLLLAKPPKGARVRLVDGVSARSLPEILKGLSSEAQRWVEANGFEASAGNLIAIPGDAGAFDHVLFGLGDGEKPSDPFLPGKLARALPEGVYTFGEGFGDGRLAALAWLLESYSFGEFKKQSPARAKLICPAGVNAAQILSEARAIHMARDLINMPASALGPEELADAARALARRHRGTCEVTTGAKLARAFPMIHAVGRASARAPRLIDMRFGPARAPKITLVGKGVCFDSGGLDIKPSAGMLLMKKDMGGAAAVLALASMICDARLPVRLRVLIPAVENAISGDAFRPGDILKSRKGLSVEIGNTDAEGRLILADALDLADEESPELLISMATLTGAARVALGPDMPPFFTGNENFAEALSLFAREENDPVWRMPFHDPYDRWLDSRVADLNNAPEGGFAGAITAALFLRRFVSRAKTFAHFDIFGWVPQARPGRPQGGEAQAVRALFAWLRAAYPPLK